MIKEFLLWCGVGLMCLSVILATLVIFTRPYMGFVTIPAPCDILATKIDTWPEYHTKGVVIYCKNGTEYDAMVYQAGPNLCSGIYLDTVLFDHCDAEPPTEWGQ
jgi:hypothetical protein